jgi:hypothetical protein
MNKQTLSTQMMARVVWAPSMFLQFDFFFTDQPDFFPGLRQYHHPDVTPASHHPPYTTAASLCSWGGNGFCSYMEMAMASKPHDNTMLLTATSATTDNGSHEQRMMNVGMINCGYNEQLHQRMVGRMNAGNNKCQGQ